MWHTYYAPGTVSEALDLLARYGDACRVIAGGTDLILELERGVRHQEVLVDVSRVPELGQITFESATGLLTLGANVTHNQVVANGYAVRARFPAGEGLLAGGRAADPQPGHRGREPDHRQPGQRHDHAAMGDGRHGDTGQRRRVASGACRSTSSSSASGAPRSSPTRCCCASRCPR